MKGTILEYNEENRSGVISGDNGERYYFNIEEWKGTSLPRQGNKVDFSATGENAQAIYADSTLMAGSSKKIGTLCLLFSLAPSVRINFT
ncbi:hypothetical protein ACLKMH_16430 [Psychromonas sp. KJ10-10]|uniref:hypothetical protein n=1 Tax=Psychromonas sp. KJ10-10 TaxID=3391823 RepID=UPI0039B3A4C5